MRENRPYGSEGGGAEFNQPFLPLSLKPLLGNSLRSTGTSRRPSRAWYYRIITAKNDGFEESREPRQRRLHVKTHLACISCTRTVPVETHVWIFVQTLRQKLSFISSSPFKVSSLHSTTCE